jgi:hypothetical protein
VEQANSSTDSASRLPLLLVLAVVLGGVLVWDQWSDWSADPEPVRGASAPPSAAAGTGEESRPRPAAGAGQAAHPLASLALDDLRDTVRRPLFERTRRPVEPPLRATPAPVVPAPIGRPAADPNALSLLGVLKSDSGDAIALLRRNQSGQSMRLQEGETVDGWTIDVIEADAVILRQGDTRIALPLFRKR